MIVFLIVMLCSVYDYYWYDKLRNMRLSFNNYGNLPKHRLDLQKLGVIHRRIVIIFF